MAAGKTFCITTTDVDRDGSADIVVGNVQQPNAVYLNNSQGKQFTAIPFGPAGHVTYGLDVGDLDGDQFPEIVTANSDGLNFIYWNRPAPAKRP